MRSPALLIALLAAARSACGQEPEAAAAGEPPRAAQAEHLPAWRKPSRFEATAALWLPRFTGTTSLGGGTLDLDDDLGLRDHQTVALGELAIIKDERLHLHFGGFRSSESQDGFFEGNATFGGLMLDDGERYRAEMEITSFAAELGLSLLCRPSEPDVAELRLSPTIGLRWVDCNLNLEESGGGSVDLSGAWMGVMAGGQLAFDWDGGGRLVLVDRLQVRGHTAVGPAFGGDGGFIWELRADVSAFLTPNLALRVGFRLLDLSVEREDWEIDGGLQGMFAAVTIAF